MILQTITPVYYPIHVGNRQIFVGTGNGPKSYDAVNGDPLSVAFTPFFIDDVLGPVISQDATTRYLEFIENYPLLVNRVPLAYIASYIGVTQQSLSRIRKNIR